MTGTKPRLTSPVGLQDNWIGLSLRLTGLFVVYFLIALAFHWPGGGLDRILVGGGDGFTAGLPSKIFAATLSPWNPLVQLGQYAYANTQFQPFYPPGLLILGIFPNTLGYNIFILTHYALAGLFCYLYLRSIFLTRYGAFTGGLFFICCGFMIAHKGHQAMLSAAVWLPLILFFLERYAVRRIKFDIGLAAIGLAFSILAGFPQVTVYSMLLAVPYLIFRMGQSPGTPIIRSIGHALLALIAMAGLGCALSSLQLFAVAQALPAMTREKLSYAMFNEDSFPIFHVAAFLIPNIWGGFHRVTTYSTDINVVEVYPYVGLLPLALSILAFQRFRRKTPLIWFWSVSALAALILCFGLAPIQYVLFHVPVYNLFRASCRHLFEVDFSLCVLAAIGVDSLLGGSNAWPAAKRPPWRVITVLAGLMIVAFSFAATLRHLATVASNAPYTRLDGLYINPIVTFAAARQMILMNLRIGHPTILYPILFGAGTVILLILCSVRRLLPILRIAIALFYVCDVWSVYHMFYPHPDTSPLYRAQARPEIAGILARGFDRTHYRIYPTDPDLTYTYPLLNMMYGISDINDYTPMWLRRYQNMTGFQLNGAAPAELLSHSGLLSLTGAQYLLARRPDLVGLLRRAPKAENVAVQEIPLPPLTCPALQCSDASFSGATISLASPDGRQVSIVNFPVDLSPSANYRISFGADAPENPVFPLSVNLYSYNRGSPTYDYPEEYRAVTNFSKTITPHILWINSGPAAPQHAFVRFYTQSRIPIHIINIHISKAKQEIPAAFTEVFKTADGISVFQNASALPRFRFVSQCIPATGFDQAEGLVLNPGFDLSRQAVVEGLDRKIDLSPGQILSEDIHNNRMQWTVITGQQSFFVVDDSWFPGWTAEVDGHKSEIRIVDGFVRGVFIRGAGKHSVEMRFWPASLTYGLIVTACSLIVLLYAALKRRTRAE